MHPPNKYPRPEDINNIISVKVFDPVKDQKLYNLVKKHMVHGPCGLKNKNSPCVKDGKCSKYYPRQFRNAIIVDQDGHPLYRRRDNGYTIEKK